VRQLDQAIDDERGSIELTFIGAFGLNDPIREAAKSCVRYITENAGIKIILVSGDHEETAKSIALKTGIVKNEELDREGTVMTGEAFRNAVGPLVEVLNEGGVTENQFENKEPFIDIMQKLKILTRATPEDKRLLSIGLKNEKIVVSAFGQSYNDIEAIK